MVNKKCKFGVRSGSTLRAPRPKYALVYGKQSCIIRKSDTETMPSDLELDVGLTSNNVCLSLDKKGRWLLPEVIKDQIHSTEQAEENFQLSLFESHKLTKARNCISYHTSMGQKKIIETGKGYFSKGSVNDKPSRRNRRNRRRHQAREDDPEPEQPPPEPIPQVTYEVFYPSPKTSFIPHHINFVGNTYDFPCHGKAKPSANSRANRTTSQYVNMYKEETECDDWQDELDETEITPDSFNADWVTPTHNLLESLLDTAIRAKELCDTEKDYVISPQLKPDRRRRKTNEKLGCETKEHVVYMDENFPSEFKKIQNSKKSESDSKVQVEELHVETEVKAEARLTESCLQIETLPSSRIIIASSELTLENVSRYFPGQCYEGSGFPKRLVIDITEEVTSLFRHKEVLTRKQEAWSWLILTHDGEYQEGMQVVRVQVNSELCFKELNMKMLFDMGVYTLSEVYHSLLLLLDSCSADSIQTVDSVMSATNTSPLLTFDTLRSFTGWSHTDYHGSQSHKAALAISSMTMGPDEVAVTGMQAAENRPEFCNVCFSLIDPSLIDSKPASSLRSCDHWFCDGCWRQHLCTKTERGLLKLTCPEFDCDTEVDHVTALSVMPVRKYKQFLQRCHDNRVQQEANKKKWCPNPKCGRVHSVSEDSTTKDGEMCITCDCGVSFCFQCLGEAHWPATCQQAKDHRAKMKSLGDERASFLTQPDDFVVLVKHCPKCKQPINKNGGCPFMMCICGHEFCWACGASYPHPKCQRRQQTDVVGTKERILRHEDRLKNRPKFYKMALEHRELRCPQVLKKLKRNQRNLVSYLQNWSGRHFAEVESVLTTYQAVDGDIASIYRAVEKFVLALTCLLTEVHFIIENTAVFLQSKGVNRQFKLICHLISRLDFVCSRIKQMLEGGRSQNAKCVIERLQCMQGEVRRCLIFLIPTLAACDSK